MQMHEMFDFLINLNNLSAAEIATGCNNISSFYEEDIDEKELTSECDFAKLHHTCIDLFQNCKGRFAKSLSKY